MNEYLKVIKGHYADFKGRARRKEYWMFVLFQVIFGIIASVLDSALGLTFSPEIPYGWIYLLFAIATFLPGLALVVRRLHDVNKSGWYYFIVLIPFVGAIWLIVLLCTDSVPGPNKWGDNPKGIGNNSAIDSIGTE